MTIREHQASILAQIAAWPANPTLNPDEYARAPGESSVYWCRRAEAAECRLATATEALRALAESSGNFTQEDCRLDAAYTDARAVLAALRETE